MRTIPILVSAFLFALPACNASGSTANSDAAVAGAASLDRPGFTTFAIDGRLWVFAADSPDLAAYRKDGELAKCVTRVGAGPGGMTIKAPDAATIDAWLAAK